MNNANAPTTATSAGGGGDDGDAPNNANRWKIELRNHGSKFFNSLDDLIMVVDKPEELFKMLHDIGVKHRSYEVKAEHIQVRNSNIWTRERERINVHFRFNFRLLLMVSITLWNSVYEINGLMHDKNLSDDWLTSLLHVPIEHWLVTKNDIFLVFARVLCMMLTFSVRLWGIFCLSSLLLQLQNSFCTLKSSIVDDQPNIWTFLFFFCICPVIEKTKLVLEWNTNWCDRHIKPDMKS